MALPFGGRAGATDLIRYASPEFAIPPGPLSNIGPLVETGVDGILAPRGFGLRAVGRNLFNPVHGYFDPFSVSGYAWHKAPDGGACFAADDGGWIYVSNCESNSSGGAGALRVSAEGRVTDAYRILDHTRRNCAGGATPWQTWLSCEEIADGQVFECDPFGNAESARALPALGCFNHEAAAVDLRTRTVFMTEDAHDGRFYRFLADAEDLSGDGSRLDMNRGRLQVMNIAGYENGRYEERDATMRGLRSVSWVDVIEPVRQQSLVRAELAGMGVRVPGTIFRGGEGVWLHTVLPGLRSVPPGGRVPSRAFVFFACKTDNRVFGYDIDNGLIETVFDNASIELPMSDVDNLVVSPAGDIIVTEDGEATRLLVILPNQSAKTLLRAGHKDSELTGPAFSPDGSRLYFSSQRGPNLPFRERGTGVTYELSIPPQYRVARAGI